MLLKVVNNEVENDAVTFTDFWTLYPKRVAKKDAERAWSKIDPAEYGAILLALAAWRRVWRQRDDDQYIPYPASWLRGERWQDELPGEWSRTHASHAPANLPNGERRSPMPDDVKALLAKIRAQA